MQRDIQDAKSEYLRLINHRQQAVQKEEGREKLISGARLAVFAVGVATVWFVFVENRIAWQWLLPPWLLFVTLLILHERTLRKRKAHQRALSFYQRGSARLNDAWSGTGESGIRFLDPTHPYAVDLDLFGDGSLYQFLCIARTAIGQRQLANWLLKPSATQEVMSRQDAVDELRDKLDLRERLAVVGEELGAAVEAEDLEAWANAPSVKFRGWEQVVAWLLASAAVVSLILAFPSLVRLFFSFSDSGIGASIRESGIDRVGSLPFLLVIAMEWMFARYLGGRVQEVVGHIERAGDELTILREILRVIEQEEFNSGRLSSLISSVNRGGVRASETIERLNKLIDLLESRRNQFFFPFAAMLLWTTHLAFHIERWRQAHGRSVGAWLQAIAEMEALQSFACYAFENPERPFPVMVPSGPRFEAQALGHPLIPRSRRIDNDLSMGGEVRVILISGSNMSGKSTLLRAVGVNAVLGLAGAPVCAKSLIISPLQVGASIRINDSLQEGSSRFYAEITRLRQLVDLARGEIPLLFLLDEILHGTNSHDRRIGAEAVITSLVRMGAVGLVTTHDLALARIAERKELGAINVHFEDQIIDGTMTFDYKMRPGVVEKSNALELMRAVGLEVDER